MNKSSFWAGTIGVIIIISIAASASKDSPSSSPSAAPSPTLSADDRVADGIAMVIAYDTKCETLPVHFSQHAVMQGMQAVSTETFRAATERTLKLYQNLGPYKFCAQIKPIIHRAMANY